LRSAAEVVVSSVVWFGAVSLGLLVYLVYALLKPERF